MTSLASYLFSALPTWHCRMWWKPPGLLLSFYCKQYKLEVETLPFHKLSWNCLLCLLTTVVFESMMWETYKQWKFIMNSYVACCCWKGSCRVCFPCLLWPHRRKQGYIMIFHNINNPHFEDLCESRMIHNLTCKWVMRVICGTVLSTLAQCSYTPFEYTPSPYMHVGKFHFLNVPCGEHHLEYLNLHTTSEAFI